MNGFFLINLEQSQCAASESGEILGGMSLIDARRVLVERHIEYPVSSFNQPVSSSAARYLLDLAGCK